jgi:protocatechuate 3,4-dioxygenase beta subunit
VVLAKPPAELREEEASPTARPRAPRKSSAPLPAAEPPVAADEPEEVEATELAGRVLGTLGQPVAGARVTLHCGAARGFPVFDLAEENTTELVSEATSGRDGEFRFRLERGLAVEVRAELGPMLSAASPNRHAGQFVELTLNPGHLVHGVVTRSSDGAAVADARVLFRAGGRSLAPERETRTLADGSYVLRVPAAERAQIAAEHAEAGTTRWFAVRFASDGNAREDLVLAPGILVEGRVTDAESGEPIAGATVGENWTFQRTTTTGADGVYRMPSCERESMDMHASAHGYATSRGEPPRLAGENVRLDFRLHRGHAAIGRVVDESARPLAGVYVAAVGENDWTRSARTDEDGRFRIEDLAPDRAHALFVSRRGSATQVYDFPESEASEAEIDLGQITLNGEQLVAGRVVDDAGQPVPEAIVTLDGWNSDRFVLAGGDSSRRGGRSVARRQATSDAEGRFWFGAVAPGSYRLFARQTGRAESASVSVLVQQGDERDDLELVFAGGLAIRGSVRDEQGRVLQDVHVSAFGEDGDTQTATSTRVQADGSFEIRGLAPGTYWLEASRYRVRDDDPDEPWLDAYLEHVEAGGEPVTLVLERGATIEGVVRDTLGQPLMSAHVQPRVESFLAQIVADSTDLTGRFRIVVPRNSRWTIDVYPNLWGEAYKPPFSEPGVVAGTRDLVLTLPD